MILKDSPQGVWKILQDHGSTGGGELVSPLAGSPPGARVTLRTRASDAAGGSVSETITNAYQVAF
jgi:hypothetical protein